MQRSHKLSETEKPQEAKRERGKRGQPRDTPKSVNDAWVKKKMEKMHSDTFKTLRQEGQTYSGKVGSTKMERKMEALSRHSLPARRTPTHNRDLR